ncbi:MAG TPA: diaminopimelate epimerase [Jiangellales bacterium]|nr:diaminopimelate epimerase [Jiangellales bacterium]
MERSFGWVKGHGTRNDFVLLPDPDGTVHGDLDPALVRWLCDRRAGIGADGVIRVVRSAAYGPARAQAGQAEWFMDYRNADGSVSEMCGNGIRVLGRYLWDEGLASDDVLAVGTRGGVRTLHRGPGGSSTVEMGVPSSPSGPDDVPVEVRVADVSRPAVPVFVPNPHAVVVVDDLQEAGPLLEPPALTPAAVFPAGANVEFVVRRGPRHIALRVWERGVGETPSCGTGACAAAWAVMREDGEPGGWTCAVDVPGGTLTVSERPDGQLLLGGPAELVVSGTVAPAATRP